MKLSSVRCEPLGSPQWAIFYDKTDELFRVFDVTIFSTFRLQYWRKFIIFFLQFDSVDSWKFHLHGIHSTDWTILIYFKIIPAPRGFLFNLMKNLIKVFFSFQLLFISIIQLLTLLNELEDHIVLFLSLQRDEIHAIFSADVSRIEPINLLLRMGRHVAAEEVVVASEIELFRSCNKVETIKSVNTSTQWFEFEIFNKTSLFMNIQSIKSFVLTSNHNLSIFYSKRIANQLRNFVYDFLRLIKSQNRCIKVWRVTGCQSFAKCHRLRHE